MGFRARRSTEGQTENLRVTFEKLIDGSPYLHRFKKTFDRVSYATLRGNYEEVQDLSETGPNRCLTRQAVQFVTIADQNQTTVESDRVVFSNLHSSISSGNAFCRKHLEDHTGTVSIVERNVTYSHFVDDIDELSGNGQELKNLLQNVNRSSSKFKCLISGGITKLRHPRIWNSICFHVLGSAGSDEGSKLEILFQFAQVTDVLRLKPMRYHVNISLHTEMRRMVYVKRIIKGYFSCFTLERYVVRTTHLTAALT